MTWFSVPQVLRFQAPGKSRGKVWVAFPFFLLLVRFMVVTTYTYSLGHTLTLSRYLFPIYYLFILFVLRLQVGKQGGEGRKESRLDQMGCDGIRLDVIYTL